MILSNSSKDLQISPLSNISVDEDAWYELAVERTPPGERLRGIFLPIVIPFALCEEYMPPEIYYTYL